MHQKISERSLILHSQVNQRSSYSSLFLVDQSPPRQKKKRKDNKIVSPLFSFPLSRSITLTAKKIDERKEFEP